MSQACGHAHDAPGLSGRALQSALTAAEVRCAGVGERLTPPRRRVLEMLLGSGQPTKAYDLIAAYGVDGEAAKPPTVYRALEFLERTGMAHRIASLSAYVACARGEDAHAAAFLICDCCGATEEVAVAGGDAFAEAAASAGYAIERTTIEGHGRCPACRVAA